MTTVTQKIRHTSGVPLGGLGTGSVEIRPDGLMHDWLIFNNEPWAACPTGGSIADRTHKLDDLLFLLRCKTASGRPIVRVLGLDSGLIDLYSFSWIKCVEAVHFTGRFPVARLVYEESLLPVRLEASFSSPFVPFDSRTSGTPGFWVRFRATNTCDEPVEVSVLAVIRNRVGLSQDNRRPQNRLHVDPALTTVQLGAENLDPQAADTGTMALSAMGTGVTYIAGAYESDHRIQYTDSAYRFKETSYLIPFRDTGALPNLAACHPPDLPEDFDPSAADEETCQAILDDLLQHPFVHAQYASLRRAIVDLSDSHAQRVDFLRDIARSLYPRSPGRPSLFGKEWGNAALCRSFTLAPDTGDDAVFLLGWHFPNHRAPSGTRIGHQYEKWFDSARAVTGFLAENLPEIEPKIRALPELLHNASLDPVVAEAVNNQLNTLVKSTLWTAEGRFGVWEGLGCCGLHTMDITYQGSFSLLALFPDLQKEQMLHGARFQREDGRVHHLFAPDFASVDDDFGRVDMNPQFVMLVARDYLWTGDIDYLRTLWPHVERAMDSIRSLDRDGDGLPDTETQRNTYDVWDFAGCPAYIGSLWMGALAAAAKIADALERPDRAKDWRATLERARSSFDRLLWNGSYYDLWNDPLTRQRDQGCMSDQLSGDWFCAMLGWEPLCTRERIVRALSAIYRNNFVPDRGLINTSYPKGTTPSAATVANMQAEATWTGIEFTLAALMLSHEMHPEAMTILRDIDMRHKRAGRIWNHKECGDHYYRAMSSWTLLLGLTGISWDATTAELGFAPTVPQSRYSLPYVLPGAAGRIRVDKDKSRLCVSLSVELGTLSPRALSLAMLRHIDAGRIQAAVDHRFDASSGTLTFAEKPTLRPGSPLEIVAKLD